jgi:hypothetical protein
LAQVVKDAPKQDKNILISIKNFFLAFIYIITYADILKVNMGTKLRFPKIFHKGKEIKSHKNKILVFILGAKATTSEFTYNYNARAAVG